MRLIDADALKDDLCKPCDRSETGYTIYECRERGCGMMAVIDAQPTVEAEPVRNGRWEKSPTGNKNYKYCSECGGAAVMLRTFDYCPYCGEYMKGGAE